MPAPNEKRPSERRSMLAEERATSMSLGIPWTQARSTIAKDMGFAFSGSMVGEPSHVWFLIMRSGCSKARQRRRAGSRKRLQETC